MSAGPTIVLMDVHGIIKMAGGAMELAKRLGVGRTTVLTWRSDGRIPGSRISQISQELGISPADLIKITYPPRGSNGNGRTATTKS